MTRYRVAPNHVLVKPKTVDKNLRSPLPMKSPIYIPLLRRVFDGRFEKLGDKPEVRVEVNRKTRIIRRILVNGHQHPGPCWLGWEGPWSKAAYSAGSTLPIGAMPR